MVYTPPEDRQSGINRPIRRLHWRTERELDRCCRRPAAALEAVPLLGREQLRRIASGERYPGTRPGLQTD